MPYIMDPDIGSVLFAHPVFHRILFPYVQLLCHQLLHHGPVLRMDTVCKLSADRVRKFLLIPVSQIFQHPAVNEIKGEPVPHIIPQHTACKCLVKKFLPLSGNIFHHQGLGIVFPFSLAAAGF